MADIIFICLLFASITVTNIKSTTETEKRKCFTFLVLHLLSSGMNVFDVLV